MIKRCRAPEYFHPCLSVFSVVKRYPLNHGMHGFTRKKSRNKNALEFFKIKDKRKKIKGWKIQAAEPRNICSLTYNNDQRCSAPEDGAISEPF
jgi:hypothetical protein